MSIGTSEPALTSVSPSLTEWLKVLWARLLFPGRPETAGRVRLAGLLVLLVVPGLLLYPSLDFHLFEPDEGRYAQIPREMLDRGEWIVPYLQGEPYLDKPPMFYWLIGLSYRVLGVQDWSARLVPAIAVHLCILLVYFLGRRLLGEQPAFWGGLVLSLAPGFLSVGRLLVMDSLLSLWVSLSIFAAFEALRCARLQWSWWLVSAAACGLGVLTKGPIALVLWLPPLLAYAWLSGRFCRVGLAAAGSFLGIVLLVALPWYVAICVKLPEFAGEFFWKHNVLRFFQPFDHLEPFWYYVPLLLGGLLPATLLLVPALRFLFSSDPQTAGQRSSELGFVLLAGGWCVLFFSLSGCKLPTYILPAFPFLALALGAILVATRWFESRFVHAAIASGFALLGIAHHLVLPWYAEFRSPFSRPADVVRLAGDRSVPVVCYPRNCDSAAFYLGRNDFLNYRSKETPELIQFLMGQGRTVILFTHRHSMQTLRQVLPPGELAMTDETPLYDSARAGLEGLKYLWSKSPLGDSSRDSNSGLCYMAVVRRVR
jgi:4-amino-4-deoxy-L-arabinose transferase-like glycosyltransferase